MGYASMVERLFGSDRSLIHTGHREIGVTSVSRWELWVDTFKDNSNHLQSF